MFLKGHLDWLDGVPGAQTAGRIEWHPRPQVGAPRASTIIVDRELIRRSQTVLGKLSKHFPTAMRKLAGDVEEWSNNVTAILDRLKEAIYNGADLMGNDAVPVESLSRPQRMLVNRLLREASPLAPLLRVVIWSGWYNVQARDFLLTWLDENSVWIQEHLRVVGVEAGVATVLLAADLARQDQDVAEQLIDATLAHPDCHLTVTSGLSDEISWFVKRLQDWRNPKSIPSRPRIVSEPPQGVHIVNFYEWLAIQSQPVRQRAARLATLVLSNWLVRQWQSGWQQYHAAAHTAIRGLCQQVKNDVGPSAFHSEACRVSHELEKKLGSEPSSYPVAEILSNIRQIATDRSARFHQALCNLLNAVDVDDVNDTSRWRRIQLRLAFLDEATQIDVESHAIRYFEIAAQHLRPCDERRMMPWSCLIDSGVSKRHRWTSPRSTLIDELPNQTRWAEYFDLLSRVVGQPGYRYSIHDELAWLLLNSKDLDQAFQRFTALAAAGQMDFTREQLETAIELEGDDFSLAEVIKLVAESDAIRTVQLQSIRKLHRHFARAGWPGVISTLMRTNRLNELTTAAMHLQLANSPDDSLTPVRPASSPAIPDWARRLPEGLQQQIALALAAFPDSRSRLQRILNKHFPDPQQIQSEIDALEKLQPFCDGGTNSVSDKSTAGDLRVPPAVRQQRRLQNLRQRLNEPVVVSEAAIAGLHQKLHEALMLDLFRDTVSRLTDGLAKSLGVKDACPQTLPMRYLELIRGILDLNAPYRGFGLRLLKACWGQAEWDPRQEPRNRRFLEGMVARGLRVEPWLSDRKRQLPATDQHPTLTLAFASNEAEMLLMGYYFGTCLSPDDCNFYSAIANAIDVNKQVLYARDPQGDVVGRCLIAIGDAGALVVFRPYCHDHDKYQWSNHVARFATDLANEMGTVVSHTDHVSAVLSPAWYNDGPHDLGNSVAAEDSPLRNAIKQASESTLIAMLNEALSPVGLTESMLELVVQLPEMNDRPDLVRPLLPLIVRCESRLGASALVTFAMLAHKAEMREVASRLLKQYASNWIRRRMTHGGYYQVQEALKVLAHYHPSAALRLLRETRPRNVNRDEDEYDSDRRQLLAECFAALGRPKPASAMSRPHESAHTCW